MLKRSQKTKKTTKYGWFSKQQLDYTGGECWRYTDTEGNVVVVTHISEENFPRAKWPDLVYVGELVSWVDYTPSKRFDPLFFGIISEDTLGYIQEVAKAEREVEAKLEAKAPPNTDFKYNYMI